jgi:hypothetical protein
VPTHPTHSVKRQRIIDMARRGAVRENEAEQELEEIAAALHGLVAERDAEQHTGRRRSCYAAVPCWTLG